jgi:hypothetical protein
LLDLRDGRGMGLQAVPPVHPTTRSEETEPVTEPKFTGEDHLRRQRSLLVHVRIMCDRRATLLLLPALFLMVVGVGLAFIGGYHAYAGQLVFLPAAGFAMGLGVGLATVYRVTGRIARERGMQPLDGERSP